MEKQQFTAITLAFGLLLLQGCGGGGSDVLDTRQSDDGAGDPDAGVIAIGESDDAASGAVVIAREDTSDKLAELSTEDSVVGQVATVDNSNAAEVPEEPPVAGSSGADKSEALNSDVKTDKDAPLAAVKETHADIKVSGAEPHQPSPQATESRTDSQSVPQSEVAKNESTQSADSNGSMEADISADTFNDSTMQSATAAFDNEESVELSDDGIDRITDLIFLTGQSNAASLVTRFDAELDAPDSRVFAYTDVGWQVADLHQFWDEGIPGNFSANDPAREPYNNIIFQVGKALAAAADRRVGIVMLTAPGEGISHWDYDGAFYSKMREHALAALNAVPHKSSFDALVWMQGETDWLLEGTADPDLKDSFESYQADAYVHYYPRKLTELISNLRSDPWFGDKARFICTETIKAAVNPHLMWLNNDDDELTGCAAASDLAARDNDPHGNHFSAESLRVLGKRIADVYLQLLP